MKYSAKKNAQSIAQLLVTKGIQEVIISPGSRNAPLISTFTNHPNLNTYTIVDERCAAFVAIGMMQAKKKAVAICCTSGSALLNYYPAIAEAFYQDLPLIIISADRPQDKIDQAIGQTIRQENVFKIHLEKSVQLSDTQDYKTQLYNDRLINECLNYALNHHSPVHINVPFSEPFYELTDNFTHKPKNIKSTIPQTIDDALLIDFAEKWNKATKKIVLLGMLPFENNQITTFLTQINQDDSVIILSENTSNQFLENYIPNIDRCIFSLTDNDLEELQPTVLLTLGKNIISKKIVQFLSKYPAEYQADVNKKQTVDTFDTLTHSFTCRVELFLEKFITKIQFYKSNYKQQWLKLAQKNTLKHEKFMEKCIFSDLKAMEKILQNLPPNTHLHLGNSMVVRYAQLFDLRKNSYYFSNRGTSGIDGCSSTAMGYAMLQKEKTILVTGDISFFYDSNALWNNYLPDDVLIIVLNNGGGEIFKFIPGPDQTTALTDYFVATHHKTANHLAKMYQFNYKEIKRIEELDNLNQLMANSQKTIIEIHTQTIANAKILKEYFQFLKN